MRPDPLTLATKRGNARPRPPVRKGSAVIAAQQQITRSIHQLHRVMGAAAVGMVFCGAALPGLVDLGRRQPTGERQMQTLAGDDRLQIRVLAHRAPVALAQASTAPAAALALPAFGGRAAASKPPALRARSGWRWIWRLAAAGGMDQSVGPLKRWLGHGNRGFFSSLLQRGAAHTTSPNNRPTSAVKPRASAPQMSIRPAPRATGAPPA